MTLADRAYRLISRIADVPLPQVLDPDGCGFPGRHAYALSEAEDAMIHRVRHVCDALFERFGIPNDRYRIEHDGFGSLFVRYGRRLDEPAIACGSHVDSVMRGGLYDGLSGVVAGLIFLERLLESGEEPEVPFLFVAFRSEESSPVTSLPCLGSAVATGQMKADTVAALGYGIETRVPLEAHFRSRYGDAAWAALLHELEHPPIAPESVAFFLELHPSQGRALAEEDSDLGVVVGGIGGMENWEVAVEDPSIGEPLQETSSSRSVVVTVKGRADHTGSAPHNPPNPHAGGKPARIDALLGTSLLLKHVHEELTAASEPYGRRWGVFEAQPREITGFTTVPHDQRTTLIFDASIESTLLIAIGDAAAALARSGYECIIGEVSGRANEPLTVIADSVLWPLLRVPAEVESIAARLAADDESGALGELSSGFRSGLVRGTVTDFVLDPRSVRFKLNLRIGGQAIGEVLTRETCAALDGTLQSVFGKSLSDAGRILSKNPPSPVDESAVDDLRSIAAGLGYRVTLTPSMPAHDVAKLVRVGIPGAMVFLTDEGGSHVPTELVRPEKMERGLEVAHRFLAKRLGVVLRA